MGSFCTLFPQWRFLLILALTGQVSFNLLISSQSAFGDPNGKCCVPAHVGTGDEQFGFPENSNLHCRCVRAGVLQRCQNDTANNGTCTGTIWENAIKGACKTKDATNNCNSGSALTLVTVKQYSLFCGSGPAVTDTSCDNNDQDCTCRALPYLTMPGGQPSDNISTDNCTGSACNP